MNFTNLLVKRLRSGRPATTRRRRPAPPAFEQLDARIALAVDQYWVNQAATPWPTTPSGSAADPFTSLEQAQTAIRARLAAGPQLRDIVVNVRGGTYERNTPLEFTAADSGRNGRTVTWQAAPGESPVLSGSRAVTNWQLVANPQLLGLGLNAVWKADVRGLSVAERADLGGLQLYIDGVRGTLAETNPSAMPGDTNPTYPFGFRPLIGQYGWLLDPGAPGPNGIVYSDPGLLAPGNTNPLDWRDPTTWDQVEGVADPRRQRDVTAVARMQWREFRMPVKSIGAFSPLQILDMPSLLDDVPVGLITMQANPWRAASLGVAPASATPGGPPMEPLVPAVWNPWRITQFAGSYQVLDQPNEWYYDRVGGSVYLVCAPFVDPNIGHRIDVPVTESLLKVTGSAASPVRNLAFQGLTFAGATWLDPAFGAGYVPDQTGVIVDAGKNPVTGAYLNGPTTTGHSKFTKATPGNVSVSYARNVSFRANTFRDLGGVGLQLGTGSQSIRVVRNTFTGISSSAVTVGGASWCRVDQSIDPLKPQSKWVIDPFN
ncbi:MAG: right-handed parallel beta-helix repeat-containing protein, partial [Planctomycetia bacterium]